MRAATRSRRPVITITITTPLPEPLAGILHRFARGGPVEDMRDGHEGRCRYCPADVVAAAADHAAHCIWRQACEVSGYPG